MNAQTRRRHRAHLHNVIRAQGGIKWRYMANISILLLIAVLLGACQSDGRPVFDKTIGPDRHIPLLDGGPHAGTADTGDAVVAFEYTRQPSSATEVVLHVKGRVLSIQRGSIMVSIYLMALESDGNVLLRRVLYSSGFKQRSTYIRQSWSFDKSVTLPPETAVLAIDSYTRASRGNK
jgi:hypothetical protein